MVPSKEADTNVCSILSCTHMAVKHSKEQLITKIANKSNRGRNGYSCCQHIDYETLRIYISMQLHAAINHYNPHHNRLRP